MQNFGAIGLGVSSAHMGKVATYWGDLFVGLRKFVHCFGSFTDLICRQNNDLRVYSITWKLS